MSVQHFCVIVLVFLFNALNISVQESKDNETKIFVNPSNNAVNFVRPSHVKPTTAQVEFEPGVPPSSRKPPSRHTRSTKRPRPTRWAMRSTKITVEPPQVTPELEEPSDLLVVTPLESTSTKFGFTEKVFDTKPAFNVSVVGQKPQVVEETISSTYPPGVSHPESVIAEPDRGVVDWILGVVGFKPNTDNTPGTPTGANRGCQKCICGLTYKHNRIVGGVETQVNEYPWMVILMYNNRFFCGASCINNKYILTAGHCVHRFTKEQLSAVFLDHDRSNSYETKTFTRKINKIIQHRSYGTGGSYNNDIALLQLDQEVSFNGILKPVCLPPAGYSFSGHVGIVTGWGATASHGSVSNKLREVKVPIITNDDCKKTGYGFRITENMMCAGFSQGTKDSCQGDSGGPLHVINGQNHTIAGIVSWGEGCAEPNYPGVYTRVNRYLTWIYSNTKDACYC